MKDDPQQPATRAAPSVEDLERRIAECGRAITEAEAERRAAAYAREAGEPGAEERLLKARRAVEREKERHADLTEALVVARRDREMLEAERALRVREFRARRATVALDARAANWNHLLAQVRGIGEAIQAEADATRAFLAEHHEIPGDALLSALQERMAGAIHHAIPSGWLTQFRPRHAPAELPGFRFHRDAEAELRRAGIIGKPDFPSVRAGASAPAASGDDEDVEDDEQQEKAA
jgi:hypothetical protein